MERNRDSPAATMSISSRAWRTSSAHLGLRRLATGPQSRGLHVAGRPDDLGHLAAHTCGPRVAGRQTTLQAQHAVEL